MRNVRTLPLSFSGSPAIRLLFLLSAAAAHLGLTAAGEVPKNLAVAARVSASSQFSDAYRPQMATSGVMPSDFQPDGGDWAVPRHAERLVRAAMGPAGRGGPDRLLRPHDQPAAGVLQGLRGLRERRAEARGAGHAGTSPRPAEDRLAEAARDANPHRVPLVASRVRSTPARRRSPSIPCRSPTRSWPRCPIPPEEKTPAGAGAAQGPDRRAVRLPRHPAGQAQAAGHLARLRLPRRGLPARRRAVSCSRRTRTAAS